MLKMLYKQQMNVKRLGPQYITSFNKITLREGKIKEVWPKFIFEKIKLDVK